MKSPAAARTRLTRLAEIIRSSHTSFVLESPLLSNKNPASFPAGEVGVEGRPAGPPVCQRLEISCSLNLGSSHERDIRSNGADEPYYKRYREDRFESCFHAPTPKSKRGEKHRAKD